MIKLYKIIIADDEINILEGIKTSIDWEELGIQVIGTATNGIAAYELVKELKPDILMTDIQMPGLNGLELIDKLKKACKDMKIIIISAHQDFSYAKRAIELGVTTYITKPLKKKIIIEEVLKIKSQIKKNKDEEAKVAKLQTICCESMPTLNEYYLNQLIMGNIQVCEKVNELPFMKEFIEQKGYFGTIVLRYKRASLRALLSKQIRIEVDNIFSEFYLNVLFESYKEEIVIIFYHSSVDYIKENLNRQMEAVIGLLEGKYNIKVQVGLGNIYESFLNIKISYYEAVEALSYRVNNIQKNIFNIMDMNSSKNYFIYNQELNPLLDEFKENLTRRNFLCIKESVQLINDKISSKESISYNVIHRIYCQLVSILLKTVDEMKIHLEQVVSTHKNLYEVIFSMENLEDLTDWFIDIVKRFCNVQYKQHEKNENSIINMAIVYIYENYNKDISLNEVADYVSLNSSYFSRLFKAEAGVPFVEYVKNIKMTMAKKLLRESNDKIYTICEKVGYSSVQYFTNLFKNKVGMTPREYRKMMINS